MTELMSPAAFEWFLTFCLGALSGPWMLYDTYNLIRTRHLDRSDPVVRDKHFGYVIGILIGAIGVFGSLRFHDVV